MATRVNLEWREYDSNVTDKIDSLLREKPFTADATATLNDVDTISIEAGNSEYKILKVNALLTDDISLDFRSNFSSASEFIGGTTIGSLLQTATKIQSGLTGTTSELTALFDYQIWEKTEPIKLNLEILFQLDTNAELDVWLPATSLCSLTALTKTKNGTYIVPGIHFSNLKLVSEAKKGKVGDANNSGESQDSSNQQSIDKLLGERSKFLSITTSAFQSPLMLVNDAKPTFSKHVDETGFPIWAKVQLDLQTLFPASSDQLFRRGNFI